MLHQHKRKLPTTACVLCLPPKAGHRNSHAHTHTHTHTHARTLTRVYSPVCCAAVTGAGEACDWAVSLVLLRLQSHDGNNQRHFGAAELRVCVSVCLCVPLSLCLSVSLSLYLCVSLSASIPRSIFRSYSHNLSRPTTTTTITITTAGLDEEDRPRVAPAADWRLADGS